MQSALNAKLAPPCYAYGTDIIIETAARKRDNGFRADVVVTCSVSSSNTGAAWDAKLLEY